MMLALAVPVFLRPFLDGDVVGMVLVIASTAVMVSYLNRLAQRWYERRDPRS